MRKLIWVASGLLVGLICAGIVAEVQASRNSAGTMSGVNGPFTAGQVIASSLLNNRYSDIETEITNSLDRSGRGGMLAALRGTDGTLAAPAFSWTSETGSGLFRNGSGDVRMAISGGLVGQWTANGLRAANGAVATPSLSFVNDTGSGLYRSGSNDLRFAVNGTDVTKWTAGVFSVSPSASGATANGNSVATFEKNAATGISVLAPNANSASLWFGDVASNVRGGLDYFMSAHASADQMKFNTNNTVRMIVSNSGVAIGSAGTAISSSLRGTLSWTPGSLANAATTTNTITVTGAAAGDDAICVPPATSGLLSYTCAAQTNGCFFLWLNNSAGAITPPSGTYTCRVFKP